MRLTIALLSMLSAIGRGGKAQAFCPPRLLVAPSMITLRGGSSDTAVADAVQEQTTITPPPPTTTKELYQELLKKLETITHLGKSINFDRL